MRLALDAFIARWTASGGSERANYVSFLNDLCDIIDHRLSGPTSTDDAAAEPPPNAMPLAPAHGCNMVLRRALVGEKLVKIGRGGGGCEFSC